MSGKLYLVGVGPGDPELMTLKAVRVLEAADIVAFPQKPGEASAAFSIASIHIGKDVVLLPMDLPMRTERGPGRSAYDAMANQLAPHLRDGETIAYLCEGDPLFYGSAMYLIERLSDVAEIEIVPGITSLTAAAAEIGRPLAARNDILKVLPGTLPDEDLRREMQTADALAIIKPAAHLDRIRALLQETGHAASARMVVHATRDEQKIYTLDDVPADQRPYFAIILSYRGKEVWGAA